MCLCNEKPLLKHVLQCSVSVEVKRQDLLGTLLLVIRSLRNLISGTAYTKAYDSLRKHTTLYVHVWDT
ncbi:mCG140733, partial [Mus musculus]